MNTIYRSRDVKTLKSIAAALSARGFAVSAVVVPENEYVSGNPYVATSATNRDILEARRAVR